MSHALVAVRRGRRNVVKLRLRHPIREEPNISLPFAALVTKPGEKTGLSGTRRLYTADSRPGFGILITNPVRRTG